MTATSSGDPADLEWFLADFVRRIPEAAHAVVVSADGLLLASSKTLAIEQNQQVAAIASALTSLTDGAAACMDGGTVVQTCLEMERGYLFLMSIAEGSRLAVLAGPNAEIGLLGFEMTTLVERVGKRLTPELRAHLAGTSNTGTANE